jgi:uncharacterized membrane protein
MRKWIPPALIILAVLASVVVYPRLPETMPTHWNASGGVNGWSSRFWGAWIVPLVMAVLWFVMRLLPHIDPRRVNYEKFSGMYESLIIATMTFMLGLHVLLLMSATGTAVAMDRVMMGGVGAFFVVIGVLLPRARPNWFVGIRTPWTLSSDLSWERTHRIGGLLFIVLGVVTVISALLVPRSPQWVVLGCGVPMVIFLFVYSYRVWKGDPARDEQVR